MSFLRRVAGISVLLGIVVGFGGFLIWAIGAAMGLGFPLGWILGGGILAVVFPAGAYVFMIGLMVTWEWITGKRVDWR